MTRDDARAAVTSDGHLGEVSNWMTPTVAMQLEFHELVPYKTLLKRFFSRAPWTDEDADRLDALVRPHFTEDWWEELSPVTGLTVGHGVRNGRYLIEAAGTGNVASSVFDRVFAGPVIPEATPHPRKVKFDIGGEPAPGVWYRRGDEHTDERVATLFAEPDVTDVMVAGDFVTVGLGRGASWEERLDPLLDLVTGLFPHGPRSDTDRTRDELVDEGRALRTAGGRELHLVDPDDPAGRARLAAALLHEDPRPRRIAVAVLAESSEDAVAQEAVRTGYADRTRVVRRTAIDVAADLSLEAVRDLFESALGDEDPWIRWRAIRAIHDLGLGSSRDVVAAREEDDDFQVRFEVARALRDAD